jgi:hypothetical protein
MNLVFAAAQVIATVLLTLLGASADKIGWSVGFTAVWSTQAIVSRVRLQGE